MWSEYTSYTKLGYVKRRNNSTEYTEYGEHSLKAKRLHESSGEGEVERLPIDVLPLEAGRRSPDVLGETVGVVQVDETGT